MFNRLVGKKSLKFYDIVPCEKLFFKMLYGIFVCEIFQDTFSKTAIQVITRHDCINRKKRYQDDSVFFCYSDCLADCFIHIVFIVKVIHRAKG